MQQLAGFFFILVLLSSGLLALAGLKTLLRDISARRDAGAPGRRARPDGVDLLIDFAMLLAGIAGAAGALMGLGAF